MDVKTGETEKECFRTTYLLAPLQRTDWQAYSHFSKEHVVLCYTQQCGTKLVLPQSSA